MTTSWRTRMARPLLLLAAALLAACATPGQHAPAPLLILVSIDGFKPAYLTRGVTPALNGLAAGGVRAESMRPSFPTSTFPNHYAMVTGLRPDHSGITSNTMEDPAIPNVRFHYSLIDIKKDARWWNQGEPIWVSAEKQGLRTAGMFWPGTDVAIRGVRPTQWRDFDLKVSARERVGVVLQWLDQPVAQRPRFINLYIDDVDTAGHDHGPDSAEATDAAALADMAIAQLVAGLKERKIDANIVIVSDHGMAATSAERTISLDALVERTSYRMVTGGSYAGIEPASAAQDGPLASKLLQSHEHMQCWRKADIPARFAYGKNQRVPSFLCLADVGWSILRGVPGKGKQHGGEHGYDNLAPDMQASFIAAGPSFRKGVVLPPFDNVDVYPLVMKLIGAEALPSDGSVVALLPALL